MARKSYRKLAIRHGFSYTETFETIARHMLRTAKKEVSPLQFLLGNKEHDDLLNKKTELEVRKTGHPYFMLFELQLIYLQYGPDQWPVKLNELQRSLGIASNVINENKKAFDKVREDEKKKETKQGNADSSTDSWSAGQSIEGLPASEESTHRMEHASAREERSDPIR